MATIITQFSFNKNNLQDLWNNENILKAFLKNNPQDKMKIKTFPGTKIKINDFNDIGIGDEGIFNYNDEVNYLKIINYDSFVQKRTANNTTSYEELIKDYYFVVNFYKWEEPVPTVNPQEETPLEPINTNDNEDQSENTSNNDSTTTKKNKEVDNHDGPKRKKEDSELDTENSSLQSVSPKLIITLLENK